MPERTFSFEWDEGGNRISRTMRDFFGSSEAPSPEPEIPPLNTPALRTIRTTAGEQGLPPSAWRAGRVIELLEDHPNFGFTAGANHKVLMIDPPLSLYSFDDPYHAYAYATLLAESLAGTRSMDRIHNTVRNVFYDTRTWTEEGNHLMSLDGIVYDCHICEETNAGRPYRRMHACGELDTYPVCGECTNNARICQMCDGTIQDEPVEIVSEYGRTYWGVACVTQYSHELFDCSICENMAMSNEAVRTPDRTRMCRVCYSERYISCVGCGGTHTREDSHITSTGGFCPRCRELYVQCWNCGRHEARNRAAISEGEAYCRQCARTIAVPRTVTCEVLSGSARERDRYTYGLEIEVEFDGGCPFMIGGYHSYTLADRPFFAGWRAERDGSLLGGGEFISPPLDGVRGLAETVATFEILKEHGGIMTTRCGQHTTVRASNYGTQIEMQRLTMALEETLIALTGSFRRSHGSEYTRRFKSEGYYRDTLVNKSGISERSVAAGIKANNLVEFRYPPGTLVPEQVCINVGLARLIARLADELPEEEIEQLLAETIRIESQRYIQKEKKTHQHIMAGLAFLAEHGWRAGNGEMQGLPYDPATAPVILLHDEERDIEREVILPPGVAIVRRMNRQLTRFYERMNHNARRRGVTGSFTPPLLVAPLEGDTLPTT